jgi:hypothetical protein
MMIIPKIMLVRHLTDTCNVMHKEDAYLIMQSKEKSELISSFEF